MRHSSRLAQARSFDTSASLISSVDRDKRDLKGRPNSRKEVIQPQVPLRLPCYDFTPVTNHSLGSYPLAVGALTSRATDSHGVTGGVYKARERIHRYLLISDY